VGTRAARPLLFFLSFPAGNLLLLLFLLLLLLSLSLLPLLFFLSFPQGICFSPGAAPKPLPTRR